MPNLQCVNITYCSGKYDLISFSPIGTKFFCNDRCVNSNSSPDCDDVVVVDTDSQENNTETDCEDGEDNDGDGFADCLDLDCKIEQIENGIKANNRKKLDECIVTSEEEDICLIEYQELIKFYGFYGVPESLDVCARINELLAIIDTDPFAFFTDCIDSNDPNRIWADLAAFRVPASLAQVVTEKGDQWFVHEMNDAEGSLINADLYRVSLGPDLPGIPQEIFENIRLNFGFFDDGCNSTFSIGVGASSSNDAILWQSNNPAGAIIDIDIEPLPPITNFLPDDDATVIVSDYNNNSTSGNFNWTFSTISTPFGVNGDHPVSGHRQFGLIYDDSIGEWIFYIRGLDRVTDNYYFTGEFKLFGIPTSAEDIFSNFIFNGGHTLWECLTENLAKELME